MLYFFLVVVLLAASLLHDELPLALGHGSHGGHMLLGCCTLQQFHGGSADTGKGAGGGGHPGRGE